PSGAPENETAAIARNCACHGDDIHPAQVENVTAGQKAGSQHHRLFGNRNSQISDEHAHENPQVSPGSEPVGNILRSKNLVHASRAAAPPPPIVPAVV